MNSLFSTVAIHHFNCTIVISIVVASFLFDDDLSKGWP